MLELHSQVRSLIDINNISPTPSTIGSNEKWLAYSGIESISLSEAVKLERELVSFEPTTKRSLPNFSQWIHCGLGWNTTLKICERILKLRQRSVSSKMSHDRRPKISLQHLDNPATFDSVENTVRGRDYPILRWMLENTTTVCKSLSSSNGVGWATKSVERWSISGRPHIRKTLMTLLIPTPISLCPTTDRFWSPVPVDWWVAHWLI